MGFTADGQGSMSSGEKSGRRDVGRPFFVPVYDFFFYEWNVLILGNNPQAYSAIRVKSPYNVD